MSAGGPPQADAEAREQLRAVADEQAALRRVATVVARAAPPAEVFTEVAGEIANVLPDVDVAIVGRYDVGAVAVVGSWERSGVNRLVGVRRSVGRGIAAMLVFERNEPVHIEQAPESMTGEETATGARSIAAAPINVQGELWGVMIAASMRQNGLVSGTEHRLAAFTELAAIAIATTQANEDLHSMAEEQAALRRVATLVAGGSPADEVFAAVSQETGQLFGADYAAMSRYEREGVLTVMASWNRTGPDLVVPVGAAVELDGQNAAARVLETRSPARVDDYPEDAGTIARLARSFGIRSTVAVPITVEDALWGVLCLFSTKDEPLPGGTEERLVRFTELVATAIANTDVREELRGMAEEQAALRRVATLVALAVPPRDVFTAVAQEVARLFPTDVAFIEHYEENDAMIVVAVSSAAGGADPVELRGRVTEQSAAGLVRRTGLPARVDRYPDDPTMIGHALGIRAAVAAPITVEGHLWGVLVLGTRADDPLPTGTEERLADFTELVATAIANVEAHAELTESRARIVASADDTMRRIERDLHDGAQQRLVTLALQLRGTQEKVPQENNELAAQLDRVAIGLNSAMDGLREFARGIHPAALSRSGLPAALRALARRSAVPVKLDVVMMRRLPEPVEVAGYYVVSEALTNAAEHARATTVTVDVEADDEVLRLHVHDDGIGGPDLGGGSGIVGLRDRVEALGGRLALDSEPDCGTSLSVELPLRPSDIA